MKSLTLLFFSLAIAIPATAATFTVNSTVDAVDALPGDGVCETGSGNGICTLRAAIQEAGALTTQSTIVIPAGTYVLSQTPACQYKMVMNHNVLTENMSALCVKGNVIITGDGSSSTIIDAGGAGGATCCGSYPTARGMVIDQNATVQLSGVTMQHGVSNGGFTVWGGGAITNQGHLTVTDCLFTANNGVPGGGAIWNDNVVLIQNSTLTGNNATGYGGGGVYNEAGTATISNTTISFNTSDNGGAAAVFSSPGAISNSTINNNTSTANGGGIYTTDNLTLTNVTFSGNNGFVGGAMYVARGTTTGNNLTITGNHSVDRTGGVEMVTTFVLGNSILWGNYEPNSTSISDCNGTIHSTGHNLIGESDSDCLLTGSTTDKTGVNPLLGALGNNGGPTPTHPLLAGSPAIDGGDPGAPGSGGTACAASDQREFLRPSGVRCDVGAFELSGVLAVTSVTASHAGNMAPVELTMGGDGFVTGTTVTLRRSGQTDISGSQVSVLAGNSSLSAIFDLTGRLAGTWDVVVTNPDNSISTLPGAFTIDSGGAPNVYTQIVGPSVLRPNTSTTFSLIYGNLGNVDAIAVPVTLNVPTAIPLSISFPIAPPPSQTGQVVTDWTNAPLYVLPGPANGVVNVPLLIPVIPPGTVGVLKFILTVPGTFQEGDSFAFAADSGTPFFNPSLDPAIPSQMIAGAIQYAQANLGVTVPASKTPGISAYVTNQLNLMVVNGRAAYASSGGAAPQIYSTGELNIDAAEFAAFGTPAAGLAAPVRHATTLGAFGDPPGGCSGASLTPGGFCHTLGDHKIPSGNDPNAPFKPADCQALPGPHYVTPDGKLCMPEPSSHCPLFQNPFTAQDPKCTKALMRGSIDPNDKSGPAGSGDAHYVQSSAPFNYLVEFENQATASLPAQTVVVTDQLDTTLLDLTTFSFGPIGFGSYLLTPPAGSKTFTGGLDLRPDLNVAVKIDANLNTATGLLTWNFTTLDPATLELTNDPTAGFLPPNVTPPQGQATLLYHVQPKTGLASGATICNQATVVFDSNAPIVTPNWCNTTDDTPPTSHITALPVSEPTANFTVQWSGSDAGSGILDYTIYVSDNGGAFTPWLANTMLTQSTFSCVIGHTYGFYSIARDGVLNVEGAKSAAETSTTCSQLTPVITWFNPLNIPVGTALSSVQLNAIANVPGTFVYTPPAGAVLPRGNGQTLSVLFTPTDHVNYSTATSTVQINVLGPPSSPSLVSPANGMSNVSQTPSLTWNAAAGATSYNVYFGTSPTPPLITNTASTSYGLGTLTVGTIYYWQVVGENIAGSAGSAIWSFTTQGTSTTNGTPNFIGVFTSANAVGNSVMQQLNGNVGIGTVPGANAPTAPSLDLRTSPFSQIGMAQTVDYLTFFSSDTYGPAIYWNPGKDLRLGKGGAGLYNAFGFSEQMRIQSSTGNVGIGTQTPGSALDVAGNINFTGSIRYQGSPLLRLPGGLAGGNIALGIGALPNITTGTNNIAIGNLAASAVSGGNSNNIHIGNQGLAGDSGTIRIGTLGTQSMFFAAGVRGMTTGSNNTVGVMIDSNGQLGTVSSSRRFKDDIEDMGDAGRDLMRLRPVTFRYKQPFGDGSKPMQYGLIAEDVANVYPDLVAHSADGQIETVKYQVLAPMLLNTVQRHQEETRRLEQKVDEQEQENKLLRERLAQIEAGLASLSNAKKSSSGQ